MFGHVTSWLAPYAEGALPPAQAGRIARHVFGCRRCRRDLDLVRAGRALASELRPATASPPSWGELAPLLDAAPAPRRIEPFRWALAAAAAVALAAGGLLWRAPDPVHAAGGPSPVEAAALAAHRGRTLELRTDDDRLLRRWIAERTSVELPAVADAASHKPAGAARLPGGALALSYRLGDQPVTLVVAQAPAGETAPDRNKRISRRSDGNLEIASWTRGNRSFALVSALRVDAACAVCHTHSGPAALL